jgi:hypothetical protein
MLRPCITQEPCRHFLRLRCSLSAIRSTRQMRCQPCKDADGDDLGRVQFSAALMHQRGTPAARMHALRALCQREARTLRLHQRGFCWSVSADLGLPLCAAESQVWWMANVRFWLVLRLASFVADGAQAVAGHAPCEIEVGTLAWPLESYNLTLYNRKPNVECASQGNWLVRFDN